MRQPFGGLRSFTLFIAIVSLWTKVAPAKPACNPREPCKVGFLGLEFCSCPNGRKCTNRSESTITYENVKYHFCAPTVVHECSEGEVAWVRRGLRQVIYCTCPAPLTLMSETWETKTDTTQYRCAQSRVCRTADDVCMVRNRVFVGTRTVSLLKGLCKCAENRECKDSGHTVKSRAVELQQDIFKCVENEDSDDFGHEYGATNSLQETRRS